MAAATGPPADEPGWQRSLRDAWSEIKGLVRVEVSERAAAPLVPPDQQYLAPLHISQPTRPY